MQADHVMFRINLLFLRIRLRRCYELGSCGRRSRSRISNNHWIGNRLLLSDIPEKICREGENGREKQGKRPEGATLR